MTDERNDEELRAAFQAERAAERGQVPPYAVVAAGRARIRSSRSPWLRWVMVSGAVATLLAGLWLARRSGPAQEIELARQVMAGRSATRFLLEIPGVSLLDSIPRFGKSVPGSPLRALDPGAPLGPPLTRSPRT